MAISTVMSGRTRTFMLPGHLALILKRKIDDELGLIRSCRGLFSNTDELGHVTNMIGELDLYYSSEESCSTKHSDSKLLSLLDCSGFYGMFGY